MEWLFHVPEDTEYEKLPEETSLQRQVKELLRNGGAVGAAYGVMEYAEEENKDAAEKKE